MARDIWKKNVTDHKKVKKYTEYENRAAWKLLGYMPRYRGHYKRIEAAPGDEMQTNFPSVTLAVPGGILLTDPVASRVASGVEASASPARGDQA